MWNIKTVNLIYFISFLDLFAVGLIAPLFNTHLRELGVSHTIIGSITSTYSGVQVLSGPFVGGWSDIRQRKSVLKTTLFLCGICYGILSTTNSIFLIFILRLILGIIKHTQSICKAVITDVIPSNEQTGVFGKLAALGSFGFILGPFIGGHLSELNNGFTYVCCLTAVLFFLNLGISSLLPEECDKTDKNKNSLRISIMKTMKNEAVKTCKELGDINWKEYWDSLLLRFLFSVAMTCFFSNQSLYLKEEFDLSQKHIGYVISFFSTIGTLSAFFLNRISSIYNGQSCYIRLFHYFSLMTLCFIAMYISSSLWIFLIILIPLSISSTVIRIVSMELMLQKSVKFHAGSLAGASNSVMSVARFVTPFLTGLISDAFSEHSIMLISAIPAILGLSICSYKMKL